MSVGSTDVPAMDFVHDNLATSAKLRVLTVVDTFSRSVPVRGLLHCYRGEAVVRTLERVCPKAGHPKATRINQAAEFVSR